MFKLIKIHGARNNAPEIVEIEAELYNECVPGRFYTLDGGLITNHNGTNEGVVFTPIEHVVGDGSAVKIKGFYVTGDMVFECTLYGGIGSVRAGSKLSPYIDDSDTLIGVSSTIGSFAYAMDTCEFEASGKISIRLAF